MKLFVIFLISNLTFKAFGQIPNPNPQGQRISTFNETDSTLKVFYDTAKPTVRNPVFLINGQFVSSTLTLNPNLIENIDVIKKDTVIDNVHYYGLVKIKSKNNYIIKAISLTQLKLEYTDLKSDKVIFSVDNEIVNTNDYDKYLY